MARIGETFMEFFARWLPFFRSRIGSLSDEEPIRLTSICLGLGSPPMAIRLFGPGPPEEREGSVDAVDEWPTPCRGVHSSGMRVGNAPISVSQVEYGT